MKFLAVITSLAAIAVCTLLLVAGIFVPLGFALWYGSGWWLLCWIAMPIFIELTVMTADGCDDLIYWAWERG